MTPALSRYFDLVRFGAALVVLVYHAWPIFIPRHPLPWPGHDAVVVFFVMSGFVIAHATDRKTSGALVYGLDRLVRLWSVAVPALLIACGLRLWFGDIGIDDVAPAIAPPWEFLRNSLANLFFMADGWGIYWQAPLNGPFWSLNYEAWYYAIFGAWVFAPRRWRWKLAGLLAVASGPKIILLMPCWLGGVWLHHASPRFSERVALTLFAASIVAYGIFFWFDIGIVIRSAMVARWPDTMRSLALSNRFVGDNLAAAIVMLNFAAAASLGRFAWPLVRAERPIRYCAALTLSIYLYHMPLIALFRAGLGLHGLWALGLVAPLIWALGLVTEQNRGRIRRRLTMAQP